MQEKETIEKQIDNPDLDIISVDIALPMEKRMVLALDAASRILSMVNPGDNSDGVPKAKYKVSSANTYNNLVNVMKNPDEDIDIKIFGRGTSANYRKIMAGLRNSVRSINGSFQNAAGRSYLSPLTISGNRETGLDMLRLDTDLSENSTSGNLLGSFHNGVNNLNPVEVQIIEVLKNYSDRPIDTGSILGILSNDGVLVNREQMLDAVNKQNKQADGDGTKGRIVMRSDGRQLFFQWTRRFY